MREPLTRKGKDERGAAQKGAPLPETEQVKEPGSWDGGLRSGSAPLFSASPDLKGHAAMLSGFPAGNAGVRQFMTALHRGYGNRYVQRVVALAVREEEGAPAAVELEGALQAARGDGQGLESSIRDRMEPAFGADFSTVRVHTGSRADSLNRALNARAFTTGQDIFFRDGEYNPGSVEGRELLAHELTHVVQQSSPLQQKGYISEPGDECEREADSFARNFMAMERQPSSDLPVKKGGVQATQYISLSAASGTQSIRRKLKFTGTTAHIGRVLAILNGGLIGYTVSVDAGGNVSIAVNNVQGPPSTAQSAMYSRLNTIVGDSNQVTIGIGAATTTIGGSYALQTIDIADIEAFGSGSGLSAAGALIHELEEQYRKQVSGQAYPAAHAGGMVAEAEQGGATRGAERYISQSQNADGTVNAVVEVPYTYPDGRVVTLTITISHNDITSVTRR